MSKYLTAVILFCAAAVCLYANNRPAQQNTVSISVDCPTFVTVGQSFAVSYELFCQDNEKMLNISLSPAGDSATLLAGPAVMNSQSMSVINGKAIEKKSRKWTYQFRAEKAGIFTTPSFTITENSDTLPLAPVSKKVIILDDNGKCEDNTVTKADTAQVFLRAEIDKPTVQLGDSLVLSIALISDCSDITNIYSLKYPTVEDCYSEELPEQAGEAQLVTINQRNYYKRELVKYKVIPLRKGAFRIDEFPMKVELLMRGGSPADSFFEYVSLKPETVEIQSDSVTFNVE